MEIKIPKEVRLHKETVLFGLTLRQLLCSGLAVGTAVVVYLALGPILGKETASWVCILAAAPFAVAGAVARLNLCGNVPFLSLTILIICITRNATTIIADKS